MNATVLIEYLKKQGYTFESNEYIYILKINGYKISFNINTNTFNIEGINVQHKRILDLTKEENHSVVYLLIKLLKKGYSPNVITLEKCWQLGHNDSGYLDVMLENPTNKDIYD